MKDKLLVVQDCKAVIELADVHALRVKPLYKDLMTQGASAEESEKFVRTTNEMEASLRRVVAALAHYEGIEEELKKP